MDGLKFGQINERTGGQMDGWIEVYVDGLMNGWMGPSNTYVPLTVKRLIQQGDT